MLSTSTVGDSSTLLAKYPPGRSSWSKVLLSNRSDCLSLDGLYSVKSGHWSAQEIISMISSRPTVTKLDLSHNALRDDGCMVLFKFLCSDPSRKNRISEIKLGKNGIGDRGLLAISEFLYGNETLIDLYLPANAFQNTPSVTSAFTAALNISRLEKLNLSSNRQLSDPFVAAFLSHLDSPHLRDLCLSIVNLTPLAVPDIVSYISSPRCRLHSLSLNGNALGLQGVTDIIKAVEKNNFGLGKVQLYSNRPDELESDQTEATKENEQILKRALLRNQFLKMQTESEALGLLLSARASLLQPKSQQEIHNTSSPSCPSSHTPLPFLPTELRLHVLSFLAPTLSSAQRIRIYTYASTFDTLPALLPRLASNGSSNFKKTGCLDGSIREQREVGRGRWLKAVGCDFYEREYIGTRCH